MSSFFEKLKKGMGMEAAPPKEGEINTPEEVAKEEEPKPEPKPKKSKKKSASAKAAADKENSDEEKIKTENKEDIMEQKNEKIIIEEPSFAKASEGKEKRWPSFAKDQEGQLAVDVYQTEEFLVIQSAIAGIKPESLDIIIEGDMVAIKGVREKPEEKEDRNYFYQECFWGPFSRQIILSLEVDPGRAEALLKDGILTIRMPKIERDKKRKLVVKG